MKGRKFKNSMLDYAKLILSKMSFDKTLFIKEFWKAFRSLSGDERKELVKWVRTTQPKPISVSANSPHTNR